MLASNIKFFNLFGTSYLCIGQEDFGLSSTAVTMITVPLPQAEVQDQRVESST